MIFETFPVGPLQCNCTILADEEQRQAMVIDPGDDADRILALLAKDDLTLARIVCTHAHIDHVGAVHELQQRTGAGASIHEDDLLLFDNLEAQAAFLGLPAPETGRIDRFLSDGDTVACRAVEMGVLHTPGHTPGSLSFQLAGDRPILFTGDTLFLNGIGRTDLWGGSYDDILKSIRTRLLTLDEETRVIPGHGPSTTIGREKAENPFLR